MAKTKTRFSEWRAKLARLFPSYSVTRSFVALSFLFLSFAIITPLARGGSDLTKLGVAFYGFIISVLALGLMAEFFVKTFKLQIEPRIRRYAALTSYNGILGFTMALVYFNIAFATVVRMLATMQNYNTVWCHLRFAFANSYRSFRIYQRLDDLVYSSLLIFIALFVLGGAWERWQRFRK